MEEKITPGIYKHFKGGEYEVFGVAVWREGVAQFKATAVHSETRQPVPIYLALNLNGNLYSTAAVEGALVLYRPLYGERLLTVRPLAMFTDHITRDGYSGPRFTLIEPEVSEALSDEITVNFGEEKYSPIQYENFAFGNIFYKTKIRPGEGPEQAFDRAWAFVESAAKKQFLTKRNGFWQRHEESKAPVSVVPVSDYTTKSPDNYLDFSEVFQNFGDPQARTMADLVTPKQLVAIRAIANAQNVNAESECLEQLKCKPEELSRRAASIFIDYLKTLPKNGN